MSAVFADTWFFLALLNRADPGHARATRLSRDDHRHRVTTDWVLVEVGDALARTGNRDVFAGFYDWIRNHSGTTIVPATRSLLENGRLSAVATSKTLLLKKNAKSSRKATSCPRAC